jgi:hypothetical protein
MLLQRVLATDFPGHEKGPEFHFQMKSLLGTGVFNADGELWKCVHTSHIIPLLFH